MLSGGLSLFTHCRQQSYNLTTCFPTCDLFVNPQKQGEGHHEAQFISADQKYTRSSTE